MTVARGVVGLGAFCLAALPWLADVHAVENTGSTVAESRLERSERRAAEWDLGAQDWSRYEALMRGRRGTWTPDADPLLVLGAHARTEAERRRFAEAFVLAEHERVEGEFGFERAVQAAWKRLFPGQLRIAMPARSPLQAADRYAVVVDRECANCGRTVRSYVKGSTPVDVYVRGAADDEDLRAWVLAQGIDPARVLGGQVTVNHGDASVPGAAPAVWARRGDRWSAVE